MIVELANISFQGSATHYNSWQIHLELKDLSCSLESGNAYHIISDHEDNALGLCWILGGIQQPQSGSVSVDGRLDQGFSRREFSWFVRFDEIKRYNLLSQSVKRQIAYGVKHYASGLTTNDFIEKFKLSTARINRPLWQLSTEGYRASCAIGLANAKRIFCWPPLEKKFVDEYRDLWFASIVDLLKKADTLVILPMPSSVDSAGLCEERLSVSG